MLKSSVCQVAKHTTSQQEQPKSTCITVITSLKWQRAYLVVLMLVWGGKKCYEHRQLASLEAHLVLTSTESQGTAKQRQKEHTIATVHSAGYSNKKPLSAETNFSNCAVAWLCCALADDIPTVDKPSSTPLLAAGLRTRPLHETSRTR